MELSKDVSLLILIPSPEHVCSCPGDGDIFLDNENFISVPVPAFEMSKFAELFVRRIDNLLSKALSKQRNLSAGIENNRWARSDMEFIFECSV